ncbi:tubulin epsilon and delta complex protein 1 isoform X1 [Scophthalmus maximus]|uniref:tubulin epsilon and delta complex protein 1 isoform X1 n=1 Tax=Scophthalmus maximus TaxID=52904 RepID=UPI0015E1094A|nr:tubulin epsilon and delta complex protein 1 isoform X1 [Scophthalmus maximus]
MQRSKAPASVEVKQVIGTLGRLLVATGLDDVPAPETFRRAKFGGGPEVEGQFWQLLANILQRIGIVSSEAHLQLKGDHRKLVAAGLWQTGCHADWMYGGEVAEGEEEKHFSSRDLLLALGWLLATETLEKLLTQRVQQLDKTLLTSVPMNTLMVYRELQLDSAFLRRLQWLIGYLRHQRRILLSMLEERTQLLHAVFSACFHSAVSSSPDQSLTALNNDCDRVRQLCDLLEAYLYWKQVEKIFWTWMDSVMDCHLTDPVVKKSLHTPDVCHQRNQGLETLEDILSRQHTAQKRQRRGRGDTQDRGGERCQGGLGPSSLFCLPSQAYRIMLQVERPVRDHIYPAERSNGSGNAPDKIHVSQAVQLLLQTEALLLERRDRQRLANRMQLQEMVGEVEGLVLIPP